MIIKMSLREAERRGNPTLDSFAALRMTIVNEGEV